MKTQKTLIFACLLSCLMIGFALNVNAQSRDSATQLTFDSGSDTGPTWSPTGNTIAFASSRGNSATNIWDIWAIEADSTNLRQLAEGPQSPFGLSGSSVLKWIGDSGDLVTNERTVFHEYLRFNLSQATSLPVVRTATDGSDSFFTRLLLIPGGLGGDGIDVSKDGTQIAWQIRTSSNGVTPIQGEIRVAPIASLSGEAATTAGIMVAQNSGALFGGFSFSPDGTQMVVSLNGNLVIYTTGGVEVKTLTSTGNDTNPEWSRQNVIAYRSEVDGKADIYVINADGTNKTQVTSGAGSNSQPTWSPNGDKIAFVSDRSGNSDLWIINAPESEPPAGNETPDSGPIQLTTDTGSDTGPTWSPIGNTIAFASSRSNAATNIWDIWAVEADATNLRQLAEGPQSPFGLSGANVLKWIGDSGDLVTNERAVFHEYMRFNLSQATSLPVVRTASDNSDDFFKRLLLIPGGLGGDGIAVSKDGAQVAWQIRTSSNGVTPIQGEIRVAQIASLNGQDATTAGTVVAQNSGGLFSGFSFSPDGAQIVVAINGNLVIYSTGGVEINTVTVTGNDREPDWSKQNLIAYRSESDENVDIYVIGPDGSNKTKVTTDSASDSQPTWAPNGDKIAFVSDRSGNSDIWVLNVPPSLISPGGEPTPTPTPATTRPIASFNADPLSGEVPLTVQFNDTSSGAPDTWFWNFGDGNTSESKNPSHLYNIAGFFSVSLTVANAVGADTIEKRDLISVVSFGEPNETPTPVAGEKPTADFIADQTFGPAPHTVQFTDISKGHPTSRLWDFGDGGGSAEQNPSHKYLLEGIFSVSLTVSNTFGEDTKLKENLITVVNGEPTPVTTPTPVKGKKPTADFIANQTTGPAPLDVKFTDISEGLPTSWLWDFGDGQSIAQNPSHTYHAEGIFDVSLTVANESGEDTKKKTNFIKVENPKPPQPGKSFTFKCDKEIHIGLSGLEILNLSQGESVGCVIKLVNRSTSAPVPVSANLLAGISRNVEIKPLRGVTDSNDELAITITGTRPGRTWTAWAVPNSKGLFMFNKRSYDKGKAWGMFVDVK